MKNRKPVNPLVVTLATTMLLSSPAFAADSGNPYDILRNGLMGAAVGAVSSEFSGGKAGTGALIGAGTQVIGKALFDVLLPPVSGDPWTQNNNVYAAPAYAPVSYSQPVQYVQAAPTSYIQAPSVYYAPPAYVQRSEPISRKRRARSAPRTYSRGYASPSADPSRQIIRNGLMGAAVGAISAEVSGGKAGAGALAGAGSNVFAGALMEILFPQNG